MNVDYFLRAGVIMLPLDGEPKNCVELIVYDNDGPEGFFARFRFEHCAGGNGALRKQTWSARKENRPNGSWANNLDQTRGG